LGKITKLLNKFLPDGQVNSETAVLTADGIKVPEAYGGDLDAVMAVWQTRDSRQETQDAVEAAPPQA